MKKFAYVIGNSWQLTQLTERERKRLDHEPFVFCCNAFLSNWRMIGFRPTYWCFGDTRAGLNVSENAVLELFKRELNTAQNDVELRNRIHTHFVCLESQRAVEIMRGVNIRHYIFNRHDWLDQSQKPAQKLGEKIFHFGSTLTDLVNFAWIVTGGLPIKIVGCQYDTRWGHFYGDQHGVVESMLPVGQPKMCDLLWTGLSMLRDSGVEIIDCNTSHGSPIPQKWALPRSTLF